MCLQRSLIKYCENGKLRLHNVDTDYAKITLQMYKKVFQMVTKTLLSVYFKRKVCDIVSFGALQVKTISRNSSEK